VKVRASGRSIWKERPQLISKLDDGSLPSSICPQIYASPKRFAPPTSTSSPSFKSRTTSIVDLWRPSQQCRRSRQGKPTSVTLYKCTRGSFRRERKHTQSMQQNCFPVALSIFMITKHCGRSNTSWGLHSGVTNKSHGPAAR